MSEKVYIEIDASPWMDAKGVTTSVFMGDAGEPCYENLYTYEELIDKELYANTVYGVLTNKYGHDSIDVAEAFVVALEQAAKYARERFESLVEVEDGN